MLLFYNLYIAIEFTSVLRFAMNKHIYKENEGKIRAGNFQTYAKIHISNPTSSLTKLTALTFNVLTTEG